MHNCCCAKVKGKLARVLVSLLLEEATQLSQVVVEGEVVCVNQVRPFRHGCKVSVLLHKTDGLHLVGEREYIKFPSAAALPQPPAVTTWPDRPDLP